MKSRSESGTPAEDMVRSTRGPRKRSVRRADYARRGQRVADRERFHSLLNQVGEMIFVLSLPQCRIVDVNDSVLSVLDCRKPNVVGRPFSELLGSEETLDLTEFFHPEIHQPTDRAGDLSVVVETRLRCSDEGSIPVELSLRQRGFRSRDYGIVVARDISRRLEAERKAHLAHQRLAEAVETLPDAFAIYDANDRLAVCNRKYHETYARTGTSIRVGATFEEIIRAGLANGQYPDAIGCEEAWLAERLARHADPTGEFEQRHPNGRWLLVRERRTRHGETVGERTDITEIKRREHELIAANQRIEQQADDLRRLAKDLGAAHERAEAARIVAESAREAAEAANRAKSQFLAMMSHELRTPLNAIIGFSEMMVAQSFGPIGEPHYESYAELINESGRQLLSTIKSILDLAKIETGKYEIREEPLAIAGLVFDCCRLVEPMAADGDVKVIDKTSSDLPHLLADRNLVERIVQNLLSNAIKFTPPGGNVTVSTRCCPQGGAALIVSDTGIGMDPEDISKALRPFEQVDQSLSRRYSGTGLGLPLAQHAAAMHGGTLGIESRRGKGTRVTVSFPPERSMHCRQSSALPNPSTAVKDAFAWSV